MSLSEFTSHARQDIALQQKEKEQEGKLYFQICRNQFDHEITENTVPKNRNKVYNRNPIKTIEHKNWTKNVDATENNSLTEKNLIS